MRPDAPRFPVVDPEAVNGGNKKLWDGLQRFVEGLPQFQRGEHTVTTKPSADLPELVTSFDAPNGVVYKLPRSLQPRNGYKVTKQKDWEVTYRREEGPNVDEISLNLIAPESGSFQKGRSFLDRMKTDFKDAQSV